MAGRRWLPEEFELLKELIDQCQSFELGKVFRKEARKKGLPHHRTDRAIRSKVDLLRLKVSPEVDRWGLKELAQILKINPATIRKWVKEKRLKARRSKHLVLYSFSRKQLKKAWERDPSLFYGCDREGLFFLFDEPVDPPYRKISNRAVRVRYESPQGTITEFESMKAAARALFVHPRTIKYHLDLPLDHQKRQDALPGRFTEIR